MLDPTFAAFFWGRFFSSAGVWVHSIVAAVFVYDQSGSTFLVGLVSVAQFMPQIVLTPLAGSWADRGNGPHQVLIGRVMCALGSGSIALWTAASPTRSGRDAYVVLAASLLVGLGFVVGGPSMQSMVPALVRPAELAAAMSLNTVPMTTARIAGPAIGATLYAHFGPSAAFAIAAGTHLVFVAILAVTHWPSAMPATDGVDYSLRAGLRYLRQDRVMVVLLLAVTAVGFGTEPSTTLAPALADVLGGSADLVGQLSSCFGLGAGAGLVVIWASGRRLSAAAMANAGLWVMAVGLVASAGGGQSWHGLATFAITGCGFSVAITGLSTLIQSRVPDHLRGRVMAFWLVGFVGSRPLAAVLLGTVSDLTSVRPAFVATALILAAAAVVCSPRALGDPVRCESEA